MTIKEPVIPIIEYPEFEEIIEICEIIKTIISNMDPELCYDADFNSTDIDLIEWRLLWLSYPDKTYQHLIHMKKFKQPVIFDIANCIHDIRYMTEYNSYFIDLDFDYEDLLEEVEKVTTEEIFNRIYGLFQFYISLNKHHFDYQKDKINIIHKRLLNDMLRLYHIKHLSSLRLDTENKFSYYLSIIENYSRYITSSKNKNVKILSMTQIKNGVFQLIDEIDSEAKSGNFENILPQIAGTRELTEFDVDLEIEKFDMKDLHLQDQETITSVERAIGTLTAFEDNMATLELMEYREDNYEEDEDLETESFIDQKFLNEAKEVVATHTDYDVKFIIDVANLQSVLSIMIFVTSKNSDPHNPTESDVLFSQKLDARWKDLASFEYFYDEDWREKIVTMKETEIKEIFEVILNMLDLMITEYSLAIDLPVEVVDVHIPNKIYSRDFLMQQIPEHENECNMSDEWRIEFGSKLLQQLRDHLDETVFNIFETKD